MIDVKFDHEGRELYKSFMLTESQGKRLDSIIAFESIVADSIINQDYDGDSKAAPRVLKTKTGVASRCLKHAKNEQEAAYMLFVFIGKHDSVSKLLALYESINDMLSGQIENVAMKEKGDFPHMPEEEIRSRITEVLRDAARPLKPMKKLIRQIENANHDFDLFKAMIDEDDNPEEYIADVIDDSVMALKNLQQSGLFKMRREDEDDED